MKHYQDITDPSLAKALAHPLRTRILAALEDRTASPSELADELDAPLGIVSYHVRRLTALGFLKLVKRVPSLLKVSAAGQLDHLIRQALPGITLTYVPTPPSAVPVKLDYHYFMLQKAGPEWEAVSRARNIAAYVPGEMGEVQIELVVLLGAKA